MPGGTGVAVVPNGTAPALKQPYLPGQYTEYPAAVQGWAQQALPGGESSIETSSKTIDDIIDGLPETTNGKGVARNFESTSDFEQTIRDFDALNPINVKEIQTKYGQVQLINGEKQGLTIKLSSSQTCVMINFGMVQAVRMLDEGIVQSNLYSENEIRKYKDNDFQNIIYEVQDGEFSEQINQISDGYGEALNLKHYVVITQNYNIDIVTEWEPTIEISKM